MKIVSTPLNPRSLKITLTDQTAGLSFSRTIHIPCGATVSDIQVQDATEELNTLLNMALHAKSDCSLCAHNPSASSPQPDATGRGHYQKRICPGCAREIWAFVHHY